MPIPPRLERGTRLVLATHNAGKIRELNDLLAPFGLATQSARDLALAEPDETGDSFEANAVLKALAAAQASGSLALADDSGLAVDALGGAPGIHSARWAGEGRDFAAAMRRVEDELARRNAREATARGARFVAVLALATPDGASEVWRGEVAGHLVWPPRGDQGFGYDPVFLPDGHDRTFGEMNAEEKHGWRPGAARALSHRARAFAAMAAAKLMPPAGPSPAVRQSPP
ncbi:MAG: RdgB/HAM1 family non-canonical purine NTP pyrophosphatase [Bauldia sp.]